MESFSLLKYWRTSTRPTSPVPTSDDDGPFFDLEFALHDEEDEEDGDEDEEEENSEDEEAKNDEENQVVSDDEESNVILSPSDDLFFKGRLVPLLSESESDSKPQFSLLKSATKLRVLMLRFKKKNAASTQDKNGVETSSQEKSTVSSTSTCTGNNSSSSKFFTVKFKVKVDENPMLSLFRDNSKNNKTMPLQKQSGNGSNNVDCNEDSVSGAVSVSAVNKYLKKVKPLYIRVSKRYGEKLKFSTAAEKVVVEEKTGQKQGNVPSGLRVVCKHLGKSRSASSAAVAAAPPPAPAASQRRDDSLLQQQDGIQSAILHCKRSFNASRDNESKLLSRSVSEPCHEKSMEFAEEKQGEGKSLGVTEENPKKAGIVAD